MLVSQAELQTLGKARRFRKNLIGNKENGEIPKRISTAESCTACCVASALISIPHASAIIDASALVYSEKSKERILGVQEKLVQEDTMYSSECAESMAIGVRNWAQSDYGLSVTGVAGPDPGAPNAPVGLVFFGFTDGEHTESCQMFYDEAAALYAQAEAVVDEDEREQQVAAVRMHVMRVFTDWMLDKANEFVSRMRLKEAQQRKQQLC